MSTGQLLHGFYLQTRKKIPESLVAMLKRNETLLSLVRRFQPPKNSSEIYRLEGPLEGHNMRVPVSNVYPMVWGRYETDVCRSIEGVISPGWTVLDVGAHIGYHTLLMAKLVGKKGEVISFEPLPENREFLQENVMLNGYQGNVRIESMAVADRTCLLRLHHFMDRSQAFLDGCAQEVATREGDVIVPVCAPHDYFSLLNCPCVNIAFNDSEA